MTRNRRPNFVTDLYPGHRRPSRYRWLSVALWLGAVFLAASASFMAPNRTVRGVALVAVLFLVIGGAIAWLSGASFRLSSSGRELKDYIRGMWSP